MKLTRVGLLSLACVGGAFAFGVAANVALDLTAEQEEYWPAIAAEMRALGKVLKAHKSHDGKINVDDETIQRLYWAAAPLLTRLSYEQKQKVKQMAHVMGLHQVAAAL